MKLVSDRSEVTALGSVVGFGTGFDLIGVAVTPAYRASFRAVVGRTQVVGDPSPGGLADPEKNPAVVAVKTLLEQVGAPAVGVNLAVRSSLPQGAGLGSYAAKVVAGALAAKELLGAPEQLDSDFLVRFAVSMGASPLRARLALAGGGQVFAAEDTSFAFPALGGLPLTALVPDFVLDEHGGPGPRPTTVPFSSAQVAAGNALLLAAALQGEAVPDGQLLYRTTQNALEDQYLKVASPASAALVEWLREQGLPAFVSGDGPAVVCFGEVSPDVAEAAARAGWKALPLRSAAVRSSAES